ncbi:MULTISPECIES: MBL fold metallo-hydrolase [Clostridium]|uniref:MBL fold metallo-hydrolase n=1 Tax=Clostridium TaxID=1485 RepID=UPI0006C6145E|nr:MULTISPECIES: MBL fold metallo-hydrolase [Clostridium]MDB2123545.1 MBL fold metallo-hydrolase [Clostridium paraputrificum]MDU1587456.1 MBL fold metallo-hydrolase [Clostridium sp.]MDU1980070.1 MBL fold metallo-hydrolase [Clostridium sp.]MDU1995584.1 MBL fold metallo-hydrolase [Clostridium sp.]MDU6050010.1 MBL fold metallo-hydrolase [Clostridium sp.]
MIIRWLGESCFLIQVSNGRRVLLDPLNLTINEISSLNPSIITLSHNYLNIDKSSIPILKNCNTVNTLGVYKFYDILVTGYQGYHDNLYGIKRGENIIYSTEIEGIKLCHLGHIGHNLSIDLISTLSDIDILFIPIGGHFTINSPQALDIIDIIKPKYIIPMYYRNSNCTKFLDSPKDFFINSKKITIIDKDCIDTNTLDSSSSLNTLIIKDSSNYINTI